MIEPSGSPDARRAAAQLRRAGHAMVGRELSDAQLARLAELLSPWCDEAEAAPGRDKRTFLLGRGGMAEFMRTGVVQPPPEDGSTLYFDDLSFVGGALNGFSMGFRYRREGDETVAETSFGPAFEGPPDRVHGAVVSAAMDEAMSLVLLLVGQPAYTANLTVRFRAAAPLDQPVQFRSRLVERDGRKLRITCEATSAEGVFAEADGLFILAPPPEQIVG